MTAMSSSDRSAPDRHIDRLTVASSASADALRAALEAQDYAVLDLDGAKVHDKATFLAALGRDLPGPEDPPQRNWDAAADWLWQAMSTRDEQRVAVVWSDAQVLLDGSLADLITAVALFTDLAKQAEDGEGGFRHPLQLVLCLVGDGPMFPTFG